MEYDIYSFEFGAWGRYGRIRLHIEEADRVVRNLRAECVVAVMVPYGTTFPAGKPTLPDDNQQALPL